MWNGRPASGEQLGFLAFHNYGSLTSLQVRERATYGLALHVQRLRSSAVELFGQAPSEERLRACLAAAVAGADPCSVNITLVSRDVEAVLAGRSVEPDIVVSASAPRTPSSAPLSVRTVRYQRETPHLKHRATHGLIRETRLARSADFDDALFVDNSGHLSEGSTWNLLLYDGSSWVWPEAAMLSGVTMQLLQRAMDVTGVTVRRAPISVEDVPAMTAAFALNSSTPGRSIARVDDHLLGVSAAVRDQLQELWSTIQPEPLDP